LTDSVAAGRVPVVPGAGTTDNARRRIKNGRRAVKRRARDPGTMTVRVVVGSGRYGDHHP
jgi:hypothetical protein